MDMRHSNGILVDGASIAVGTPNNSLGAGHVEPTKSISPFKNVAKLDYTFFGTYTCPCLPMAETSQIG